MRQERGFLGIQWLRLNAASAGGSSSISDQGTTIPHAMRHGHKRENKKISHRTQNYQIRKFNYHLKIIPLNIIIYIKQNKYFGKKT
jgi:hypothetical protein